MSLDKDHQTFTVVFRAFCYQYVCLCICLQDLVGTFNRIHTHSEQLLSLNKKLWTPWI